MGFNVQFPGLGLEFVVNRIAFSVFGMDIYWYGIIAATAMGVSFMVAMYMAKKKDINIDHLIDVVMIGAGCAIICARIYYVVFAPFKYDSLWDMINIRDGGIAIYGAIIGAFVFGGLACKWRKLDVLEVFDITATCFLLGQSIGRWGNFINQEAFGENTTAPWGMISEGTQNYLQSVQARLAQQGIMVDPSMPVHPTFFYESVWCLIGFAILFIYYNRKKFKGEMLCWYLVWYGIGRYFIEGLRTDSLETSGGMRTSQLVAVVTVVAAIGIIFYMRKKISKVSVGVLETQGVQDVQDVQGVQDVQDVQDVQGVQETQESPEVPEASKAQQSDDTEQKD